MDDTQQLRRWPQGYFQVLEALGVENSNIPSTLTVCVSSSTNSKGTAGEEPPDEPKLMPFCNA